MSFMGGATSQIPGQYQQQNNELRGHVVGYYMAPGPSYQGTNQYLSQYVPPGENPLGAYPGAPVTQWTQPVYPAPQAYVAPESPHYGNRNAAPPSVLTNYEAQHASDQELELLLGGVSRNPRAHPFGGFPPHFLPYNSPRR